MGKMDMLKKLVSGNDGSKSGETATSKAMRKAVELGKPTSTGIAAGAGLGAIMAALGAASRSGDGTDSILTNPLLLGGLGAAGGYLAGNAFEGIQTPPPPKPESNADKITAALGLAALGRSASKRKSRDILNALMNDNPVGGHGFNRMVNRQGIIRARGLSADIKDIQEVRDLRDMLVRKARRAGDYAAERRILEAAGLDYADTARSLRSRLLSGLTESYNSPRRWLSGLNVLNRNSAKALLRTLNPLSLRGWTGKAGLAALAAGGGHFAYRKLKKDDK